MGTVLVGLLFWVSNEIEPNSLPFKTSQMVGIPKPYKARPEVSQYTIRNVNFAAEYERPAMKPVKIVDAPRKQKMTGKNSKTPTWSRLTEYPHDNLSIY